MQVQACFLVFVTGNANLLIGVRHTANQEIGVPRFQPIPLAQSIGALASL
jgi:hypothetical protein